MLFDLMSGEGPGISSTLRAHGSRGATDSPGPGLFSVLSPHYQIFPIIQGATLVVARPPPRIMPPTSTYALHFTLLALL